jgi:hypothetical protein
VARRAPLRQPKVRKILDPTDAAHWSPSLARGRIANPSLHQLERDNHGLRFEGIRKSICRKSHSKGQKLANPITGAVAGGLRAGISNPIQDSLVGREESFCGIGLL